MEKINLFDEIRLEKTDRAILFDDSQNLVFRAAALLQKESGTKAGVQIELVKKIPMGAGLGGGSGDAATVLKGLNQLWNLRWSEEQLARLGATLGADIPVFCYENAQKVTGFGEICEKIENFPKFWAVLIYPAVHVSTPQVYKMLDEFRQNHRKQLTQKNQNVSVPRSPRVGSPRVGTFRDLIEILHNDFEAVVFKEFPKIKSAKQKLISVGAAGALMSGSGSTVFGLFATKEERDRALKKLDAEKDWRVFAVENLGV